MRMLNEAIEDAAAAGEFMRRVTSVPGTTVTIGPSTSDRQPGENRADHRSRLKRERREAKRAKAAP
jgi:hypothetical protein